MSQIILSLASFSRIYNTSEDISGMHSPKLSYGDVYLILLMMWHLAPSAPQRENTCNVVCNNECRVMVQSFFLSAALRYPLTLFFDYPWHTKSVVAVFVGTWLAARRQASAMSQAYLVYSLVHTTSNACICITVCASHSQSRILYPSCLTDFLRALESPHGTLTLGGFTGRSFVLLFVN
jgi:hypothetical protein